MSNRVEEAFELLCRAIIVCEDYEQLQDFAASLVAALNKGRVIDAAELLTYEAAQRRSILLQRARDL